MFKKIISKFHSCEIVPDNEEKEWGKGRCGHKRLVSDKLWDLLELLFITNIRNSPFLNRVVSDNIQIENVIPNDHDWLTQLNARVAVCK